MAEWRVGGMNDYCKRVKVTDDIRKGNLGLLGIGWEEQDFCRSF